MKMRTNAACRASRRHAGHALFGLSAATCAAALITSSASATVLIATYQGYISAGSDGADFFGSRNLSGTLATVAYTYDTSLGVRSTRATSDSLQGGSSVGTPSIYRSITATIDGVTVHLPTGDESAYHVNDNTIVDPNVRSTLISDSFSESGGDYITNFAYILNPPASIETPFNSAGSFRGSGALFRNGLETAFQFDYGGSVNVALAAPEPNAWLLMFVGFCSLGFALRFQRGRHAGKA